MHLLNVDLKIISEQGRLYLPLTQSIDIKHVFPETPSYDFELGHREFPPINSTPQSLAEVFHDRMSEEELELLPRAYDLIGDIAVIEIPEEISKYKSDIGNAFLRLHPNFVTLLNKKGAISGTVRIRDYELIAGIDKTDTVHTEYGIRIAVDLSQAYFSPRLLEEHNRVAAQVQPEEHVIDMFTGVGPFALHIAKRQDAQITAVDINPQATALLERSMKLNRLQGSIIPITSDIKDYVKSQPSGNADRVIMNHPSGAFNFVQDACYLLKHGGKMHYYDFMGGEDPEGALKSKVESLVKQSDRTIREVTLIRKVRDSAPYEFHIVIDAIID